MDTRPSSHNPSRAECIDSIRRILMTEVLEYGRNEHFKNATDFMRYFESLYPASPSLLKQVQRAVREMDMPKDQRGYFIINKTHEQLRQDEDLSLMMQRTKAHVVDTDNCELLFLATEPKYKSYLLQLIHESETLREKYLTVIDTTDGILFLTRNRQVLKGLLDRLATNENIDENSQNP